jgi:hypothetical protein
LIVERSDLFAAFAVAVVVARLRFRKDAATFIRRTPSDCWRDGLTILFSECREMLGELATAPIT